jgi:putative phosphoribosyl transferase
VTARGGGETAEQAVTVPARGAELSGDLAIPPGARGIVLFAHGSGSSRHSPRNRAVAAALRDAGLGTLLMDLLTSEEERRDRVTGELRFDVGLLGERVVAAVDWVAAEAGTAALAVGCFGASTGAAGALIAAAERPERMGAVVSRGGRPDLAAPWLERVEAPTLLIVGERDESVIELNRRALALMRCEAELVIVPGATHLFEEPGALEDVARLAAAWFTDRIGGATGEGG